MYILVIFCHFHKGDHCYAFLFTFLYEKFLLKRELLLKEKNDSPLE